MPRTPLPKAAELESAFRRHLSRRDLKDIIAKPRVRELVISFEGTAKFPGRPSLQDIEKNDSLLRAVLETFPCQIPGIVVLSDAITLLDLYYSGDIIQYDSEQDPGFQANGYHEAVMRQVALLKNLVQRLRRLLRRSRKSRC